MLKAMIECNNVRIEEAAWYLDKLTNGFKLWMHDEVVYTSFEVDSLSELREVGRRLRKMKGVEIRFIRISVVDHE